MILVGPVLRYVDATRATVWVETDRPCEVEVLGCRARTWTVHGHHYALIVIDGLPPGGVTPYQVALDGALCWPPPAASFPPSVIRTFTEDGTFRLAFGSCRRAAAFDAKSLKALGADALAALASRMATTPYDDWPDALFLLGDQIYADEPSDELRARLRAAHASGGADDSADVREEIGNFEEYTWLYRESWTPDAIRWLLSTVPTCMLLDDHDLRDDWNTSLVWREQMTRQPWWRDRVTGAFASYWIYQHLGNLSPDDLAHDPTFAMVTSQVGDQERTASLDRFAWSSDAQPDQARWSFHRDFGPGIRLVAVDARCARALDPSDRRIVDATEASWLIDRVREVAGQVEHLIVASTLPFLLPHGVHHVEGWNEAVAGGAWGRRPAAAGERLRQGLDLEHWAAFRRSFDAAVRLLRELATGPTPPRSVLLLGGDVHCSYTARAQLPGVDATRPAIHQLTMSPFRNPLQRPRRLVHRAMRTAPLRALTRALARAAKVPDADITWQLENGPWFNNGVMTIAVTGPDASVQVDHAVPVQGEQRLTSTLTMPLTGQVRGRRSFATRLRQRRPRSQPGR